jgi:uncharacterized membrane protein
VGHLTDDSAAWSPGAGPARAALTLGRSFFGLATLASGLLQLATGDFVRLVRGPAVPVGATAAYLTGAMLVGAGLAIVSGYRVRTAAAVVGAMILLVFAVFLAPSIAWNPEMERPWLRGFVWTNPLKSLALAGGAAFLAATARPESSALEAMARAVARLEPLAALLLAVFMVVCGVQHFIYADFVMTMVPAWIPPGQRFWTYFTGVALVAGGAGILVRPVARLAAALSALMIFLWVLFLHIPRSVGGPNHANETAGTFEALALSGVALLLAARRSPRS